MYCPHGQASGRGLCAFYVRVNHWLARPPADCSRSGPGSGFFSGEFAKRLPRGRLELFDLQPEMLAKAKAKLAAAGATNIGFTAGDAGADLPFASEQFDRVVLISVLGEIPDRAGCLRAIQRMLRPAGLAVFHESIPDPDL